MDAEEERKDFLNALTKVSKKAKEQALKSEQKAKAAAAKKQLLEQEDMIQKRVAVSTGEYLAQLTKGHKLNKA